MKLRPEEIAAVLKAEADRLLRAELVRQSRDVRERAMTRGRKPKPTHLKLIEGNPNLWKVLSFAQAVPFAPLLT